MQLFTAHHAAPKLTNEDLVQTFFGSLFKSSRVYRGRAFSLQSAIPVILIAAISTSVCAAQTGQENAPQKATQHSKQAEAAKPAETDKNAAQIELLQTKYRFETNGNSRKEVHTRVRINNELGVRQFARLNFDFNRSFQSVEIPQVRITHPSGGIADILPSAITDNPNAAVVDAPAYQDVRVKSVRILGLQPGDLLEYRVITTTSHHPLAPDFWLDHTFDRSGIVTQELYSFDFPTSRNPEIRIRPTTPVTSTNKSGVGEAARTEYFWDMSMPPSTNESSHVEPDISLSTEQWEVLSIRLGLLLSLGTRSTQDLSKLNQSVEEAGRREVASEIAAKALELTKTAANDRQRLEDVYDFVSQKIKTVDLPLGSTEFVGRTPRAIAASGYATPEDKFVLLASLLAAIKLGAEAHLTGFCDKTTPARPTIFKHLLISAYSNNGEQRFWLDPSLEVAPFGMLPANSGDCTFVLNAGFLYLSSTGHEWSPLTAKLPFPSKQKVSVQANVDESEALHAKVRYTLRGDNELLLRVAFHQTPKEKWKDIAQLLAISDGFRGQITNVTASDPYATKEPFTVEYEISQPKFVDWSKKPVRIPALLPLPGLPEAASSSLGSTLKKSIDLGTPLEIDLDATVTLPEGTTTQAPTGTSVERDYATFSSKYSAQGNTVHASRKLHFISREIPATRAGDLNAFLHAVQADQTQLFTLQRSDGAAK